MNVAARRVSILFRSLMFTLAASTTVVFAWVFYAILASDGLHSLDLILIGLFCILLFWVSIGFWMATIGAVFRFDVPHGQASERHVSHQSPVKRPLPRTAVLVPIYNESPASVFAGIRATWRSLQLTNDAGCFDLFILSDTTKPDIQLEEESQWADLVRELGVEGRVRYRHRVDNLERKAGNIRDFCERWGARYRYMIVFDADSVMAGQTLVEMVCRMERDEKIGILQTVPRPVMQTSLFARCQQFAAMVYGDMFAAGFSLWSHDQGNYFGHNAIIRVEPFTKHCGLPTLPGKPPLGGEILSHDFVEAALMVNAGYKVVLADDLEGSYEQCPNTLIDFAKRDQRWCQGNLQHLKLVVRYGMKSLSRGHMINGVMSYAASLFWLTFMVAGFALVATESMDRVPIVGIAAGVPGVPSIRPSTQALLLFAVTMVLLITPKFWALALMPRRPEMKPMGSDARVLMGIVVESLVSVLSAPLLMAFHARFVVGALLGATVKWDAQRRAAEGTTFAEAAKVHRGHTVAGVLAIIAVALVSPGLLPWTLPVTGPLALSIPLSVMLSSPRIGAWLRHRRLLLIPEEVEMPRELRWFDQEQARLASQPRRDHWHRLIADPAFLNQHLAILDSYGQTRVTRPDWVMRLDKLDDAQRREFLADPVALRAAHRQAWLQWPTDRLREAIGDIAVPAPAPTRGAGGRSRYDPA